MSNTLPKTITMMVAATVYLAVVGCSEVLLSEPSVRRVSLAEFAGSPVNQRTPPQVGETSGAELDSTDVLGNARVVPPTDSSVDSDPFAGSQQRIAFAPMKPGDRVIVDSLIGEVNGRAIFADEFLVELEDHLLQQAAQTTGMQRVQAFDAIIRGRLRSWVLNELILANAEFALSEQEQQGLFAYMRSMKERYIREEGRGIRYEAEQKLRGEEGAGNIEDFLGQQRDFIVIDQLRRQKIAPRVLVSWRDREREYQRRFDEFNPPASVTLAMISLRTKSQAEQIEQVSKRLASGEEFAAIAKDFNTLQHRRRACSVLRTHDRSLPRMIASKA